MHSTTLLMFFTHLFSSAMHPMHPFAPIYQIVQEPCDPAQRTSALRTLASDPGGTSPLQRAAAHLLLYEEEEAHTLLTPLTMPAVYQTALRRIAHALMACLWTEQGKLEEALPHWTQSLSTRRPFDVDEGSMQRAGFHPGLAFLCRGLLHTLLAEPLRAKEDVRQALRWRRDDPSLLLLYAINALSLGEAKTGRHALRQAYAHMRSQLSLPTPPLPMRSAFPPHLLVPTLAAWVARRRGSALLQCYDNALDWLEDAQQGRMDREEAELKTPLQQERALLYPLLAQQARERLQVLHSRLQ